MFLRPLVGRYEGLMEKISDSAKFTEVYHLIMKAGEAFSRLSPNIPKALLEVVQHIHGSLDESTYHVFKASNTFDNTDKVRHLTVAQEDIFFLYNRIEYLVKARGISIGQANEFIIVLRECHVQLGKWLTSVRKCL